MRTTVGERFESVQLMAISNRLKQRSNWETNVCDENDDDDGVDDGGGMLRLCS